MNTQFLSQVLPWVGRIERHFSILMRDVLAPIGVTYPEFRLIGLLIDETEGVSQKDLAARLGLDASGISITLKALEKRGLIARERDKEDARIMRVKCTPSADELNQVFQALSTQEAIAVKGMTPMEIDALTNLLGRVSENLSQKTGVE